MKAKYPTTTTEVEDQLFSCTKCGMCLAVCPTYQETKNESFSPRGQLSLYEAFLNGKLDNIREIRERIFTCIDCLACSQVCPSNANPELLIRLAKEFLIDIGGIPLASRMISRQIAPSQRLIALLLWLGAWRERYQASIGEVSEQQISGDQFLLPFPAKPSFLRQIRNRTPASGALGQVGFFVGCAANLAYPELALSTLNLLEKLGFRVIIPQEQKCCGEISLLVGDCRTAMKTADFNLRLFSRKVEAVITICASCSFVLKNEYQRLLGRKGVEFANKVMDISEFLVKNEVALSPPPLAKKITYHDPCHLARGQEVRQPPRALLERIPKAKFVEMSEPESCCGLPARLNRRYPEISQSLAEKKATAIKAAGAEIVATSCPGCIMQLKAIQNQAKVVHVVELLG